MFDGDNCVNIVLDCCLKLKEERKTVKNKIVEHHRQLNAHSGSGFDTWIVLKNLSFEKHIVDIIKNCKRNIELKLFNGYFEKKASSPISPFQMWYDSFEL